MEEAVFLVVDYEGVCRLCLQAKGALSELFPEALDDDDTAPPLPAQIRALTDVHMSDTDNLPKKICHKCRYIVETCYELRTTVIKSNKLLLNSMEADELINEVTQVYKKGEDDSSDPFAEEDMSDIMQETIDIVDTKDFLVEDGSRKSRKRSDHKIDYYKEGVLIDNDANSMDVCSDSSNMIVECKVEVPVSFETSSVDDQKEYTSSKEVTMDEVKLGTTDPQLHMLPYMSDDGGSEGLSTKQKDGSISDRPHRHQTCQLCLQLFPDRSALMSHISDHYKGSNLIPYTTAAKPFDCRECNMYFTQKMDLIIHHRKHLDINPYVCKFAGCNFDIRSREGLRHHMYTHANKKFTCDLCGAKYRRKVEILRHRVRHLDEGRQFRCGLCLVICKNRLSLKAHLKNHENGRRFKCDFPGCPKAFFSNSDLVIHSRSHSNDKCYKCSLCVCAYTSQSQLNRHLRRHEKPGLTKCDKCSEVFEDYGSFCNHRIATHGEWQPHRCRGCNQGYQSKQQLEKHLTRCEVVQKMRELGTENISIIMDGKDSGDYIED